MFRILLGEDEYWEREALKITISRNLEGVKIVGETENGKKVVQLCEELKPDMVFLDIRMPGIDGIEVSRIIKAKNKDLIVVFLTAYSEAEYMNKCIDAFGDEYIVKPSRPENIINVINKYKHIVKSKTHIMNDKRKELVEQIIKNDYKESKRILGELLNDAMTSQSQNIVDFNLSCKDIAIDIFKALDQIDLKDKSLKLDSNDYLKEIVFINDSYSSKVWLFKVLDAVFERIVNYKSRNSNDGLNMTINYIEKNYHKKITLEEVAEYINMSPFYLSKIFKKEMNINFIDYITERKMEKARELLEYTEIPIINIALELSYNEPNYFSKVFRKSTGMTPSEYRMEKQKVKVSSKEVNVISKNITIENVKWYV